MSLVFAPVVADEVASKGKAKARSATQPGRKDEAEHGATDGVLKEKNEKVFEQRFRQPAPVVKTKDASKQWQALRHVFGAHIRLYLKSHSKHEDPSCRRSCCVTRMFFLEASTP